MNFLKNYDGGVGQVIFVKSPFVLSCGVVVVVKMENL